MKKKKLQFLLIVAILIVAVSGYFLLFSNGTFSYELTALVSQQEAVLIKEGQQKKNKETGRAFLFFN
ncbi:MAG: hypothetical protein K0Q97_2855 [Bacillota bacterium]|nr:hypothetical protein [Bacillota bacterium]